MRARRPPPGDARGLAAARAAVWGAVLRASFGEATTATAQRDVQRARAWLLVREFQAPTRFTRAAADATVALDGLSAGTLRPAAAASAVRADLLGTYDSRLRAALAAVQETGTSGFGVRRAEEAAAARGYWRILRGSYAAQRDVGAARRLDAAFGSLVAAASAGRGAPVVLRRIDNALEGFRAAPLGPEEQIRRAGQLQRFLELVPIEYDRGVEDGRVTLDFEIQEAITFRDAASSRSATSRPSCSAATRPRLARDQARRRAGRLLADATRGRAVADPEAVRAAAKEALDRASAAFPEGWGDAGETADFDVIEAALDRVEAAAAAGEWGARSRRGWRRTACSSSVPSSGCAASRPGCSARSRASSGTATAARTASSSSSSERPRRPRSPRRERRSTTSSARRRRASARASARAPPSSRTARSSSSARGSRRC